MVHTNFGMNENTELFERLVLSLESNERRDMLRKLAEITELSEAEAAISTHSNSLPGEDRVSPQEQLLALPFVIRLWFAIFAFLSSSSPTRVYSEHLVRRLGRDLSRSSGNLINTEKRNYISDFYTLLVELKRTQAFFLRLLTAYENNKGGFYLILGSLLMKDSSDALAKAADPFSHPFQEDPKKDLRVSLMCGIEQTFSIITEAERGKMYQAAQAIEWLKYFCDISFDRMIMRFGLVSEKVNTCLIESIGEDIKLLANVLSSGKRIPVLLLESLFLFAEQNKLEDEKFEIEKECRGFVDAASRNLSVIRNFKNTVPITGFVRFTLRDVSWMPNLVEGGEDWFGFYRSAWKKQFEQRWDEWNHLHKKAMLEKRICDMLDIREMPSILHRPWEGMWLPLTLRRELSFAFLKGVFSKLYPTIIMKPLKILLIEGDFYRRENLMEFTDAFSTLEHQQQVIETFETRLSSKGDIGEGFELIQRDRIATVKGKARLDNLMLTTSSATEVIIGKAISAFRSMDAILEGVLNVVRGAAYETLVNMASIQGKQNIKYRKELTIVRQLMLDIVDILEQIEKLENE